MAELTYDQLVSYINKTAPQAQSTSDQQIIGNKKKYQTTYAFGYVRNLLESIQPYVTDASEKSLLAALLASVRKIPAELSLEAIKTFLSEKETLQSDVLAAMQSWLSLTENSCTNGELLHRLRNALYFLLLAIEGDIEINKPYEDKKVSLFTLLKAEDKQGQYNLIQDLKTKCCEKSITPKKIKDPLAHMQQLQLAATALASTKQNEVVTAINALKAQLIENLTLVNQQINQLNTVIHQAKKLSVTLSCLRLCQQNKNLHSLWNQHPSFTEFENLLKTLGLSTSEQETWRRAYREQFSQTNIDWLKGWARYLVSYTYLVNESVITPTTFAASVSKAISSLEHQTRAVTAKTPHESQSLEKKLNHAQQQLTTRKNELTTLKIETNNLVSELSSRDLNHIKNALSTFLGKRTLLGICASLTSSSYRQCVTQMRSILADLEHESIAVEAVKSNLGNSIDQVKQNGWLAARKTVDRFTTRWNLFPPQVYQPHQPEHTVSLTPVAA